MVPEQQEPALQGQDGSRVAEHKKATRYVSHFPVRIFVGMGDKMRIEHVIAHDVEDGGLILGNTDIPNSVKRIRVQFRSTRKPPHASDGEKPQTDVRDRYANPEPLRFAPLFARSRPRRVSRHVLNSLWLLLELATTLAFVAALGYEAVTSPYFWFDPLLFSYSLVAGVYLISRFFFSMLYSPPAAREDLPAVSIIIPARNAQKHVAHTIGCALSANYPDDKLQVIAVNDGSDDGTLATMRRMRNEYPQLEVIDMGRSRGKRLAVVTASHIATGEIIVVVDAGSFLDADAIRNVVDGFTDSRVAGVCGHCIVANAPANLLTRMQAVRYFITYRVLRASESLFGAVTLLPGSFAAYRKRYLVNVLGAWIHQRFLGRIASHGDDRALTNLLLKHHRIIYDRRACARTMVPEHLHSLLKVQTRWRRSWFREGIHAASFMWRKRPLTSMSFYAGVLLTIMAPAIAARALLNVPLEHTTIPLLFLAGALLGAAVVSTLLLLTMRARYWAYGIPSVIFYALVLLVQVPWAILTCWQRQRRET